VTTAHGETLTSVPIFGERIKAAHSLTLLLSIYEHSEEGKTRMCSILDALRVGLADTNGCNLVGNLFRSTIPWPLLPGELE
jgi:hypothetical protein